MDNASNNITLLKEIENACIVAKINFDYRRNHVRCLAHIMNLTTQEILKHIKAGVAQEEDDILQEMSSESNNMEIIPKLRKIVVKICSSPQRRERFARQCDLYKKTKSLNLILDVRTRWNSTYFMLQRALKLRKVSKFNRYNDDLEKLKRKDSYYFI